MLLAIGFGSAHKDADLSVLLGCLEGGFVAYLRVLVYFSLWLPQSLPRLLAQLWGVRLRLGWAARQRCSRGQLWSLRAEVSCGTGRLLSRHLNLWGAPRA